MAKLKFILISLFQIDNMCEKGGLYYIGGLYEKEMEDMGG